MATKNIIRTYTARLYPTGEQEATFYSYLKVGRRVYNHGLEQRIKAWKRRKESVSYYDQCEHLTLWRGNDTAIRDVPRCVGSDALRRIDLGFQAFFRRVKAGVSKVGFPRFKSRNRWNSFTINEPGEYVYSGRIRVPKLGLVKCRGLQEFTGKQKSLRVLLKAGKWYAQIVVDTGVAIPPKRPIVNAVGIDVGLTSFLVDSTGAVVDPPKYFRKLEKKLAHAQRMASRKVKGSGKRRKAYAKVASIHERIANCRSNFTHHLSKHYAKNFDLIVVEALQITNMVRGRFGKSILDAAWGQFFNRTRYKVEKTGSTMVDVDPRGSSQECCLCGGIVKKDLSVRIHVCPCGNVMGRDENSSHVIFNRGVRAVSGAEFKPAEKAVAPTMKREVLLV